MCLLLSGSAAAVSALNLYRQEVDRAGVAKGDEGNLISMEIGGTSCDMLLLSGGEVATRGDVMAGYHVSTPAIDIYTVGADGGAAVRPQSAPVPPTPRPPSWRGACWGETGRFLPL